jgi:hypothetical protein
MTTQNTTLTQEDMMIKNFVDDMNNNKTPPKNNEKLMIMCNFTLNLLRQKLSALLKSETDKNQVKYDDKKKLYYLRK